MDCILLGPYDLSASMGKMGHVDDPEVIAAIDHVTKTCQAAGMPLGYFGVSPEAIKPYVEQGYTLIVAGTDTIFLASGARHFLKKLALEAS